MQKMISEDAPDVRDKLIPEPDIYKQLCLLWQSQPFGDVQIDYSRYIQQSPGLELILNNSPCVTWILDLRTLHFCFISNNVEDVFGYQREYFEEKGLNFFNQIVHSEDVTPTWHLVKEIWECLMALPPYQRKQHKLNFSYRIIKPDGAPVHILEQNSVLQLDNRGHVTHIMGVCSDISQLDRSEGKISAVEFVSKKPVFFNSPANPVAPVLLSKRELQIVKLIAAGYNSRDIAEKLFISFNTVNTHRQKIIGKTHTKNTGELIRYVMKQNLI